MKASTLPSRQAHRLIQLGIFLFLLALFVGLAVQRFSAPRIALSVHLLGLLQGMFLISIGLLWPKLDLDRFSASLAFWLLIYGCLAAWTANFVAAVWGAGNTMLPLAAGTAHGSSFQELVIMLTLRSAALALIVALVLLLWGTRRFGSKIGA